MSLITEVTTAVKALHSYDLPESIALPVLGGNLDYIEWVRNNTKNMNQKTSTDM